MDALPDAATAAHRPTSMSAHARGYAIAIVALGVTLGIRELLDPWLGDQRPLAMMYGAIAAASWFGGLGPAVFACVVGYLACDWAFIPPRGEIGFASGVEAIGALVYALSSSIIVALSIAAQRSARRALIAAEERARAEAGAREQVKELARHREMLEPAAASPSRCRAAWHRPR